MDAYVQTRWLDRRIAELADRDHGLAAVRAIGPGAVLSHVHAAALFDLRPAPGGRIKRDGGQPRPPAAEGTPRPQRSRARARACDNAAAHPGHDARADAL